MAEIVPVVSEALEAQIRDLLPSQRGFGEDLQASNVITPIIDLTAAAQGTTTPISMQQALAFGSQTVFNLNNTTSNVITTAGFWRIVGTSNLTVTTATIGNLISMSDGLSTKNIWGHYHATTGANDIGTSIQFDLIVFTRSGDSVSISSGASTSFVIGSVRQIADVNGNLVNPSGFTPQ